MPMNVRTARGARVVFRNPPKSDSDYGRDQELAEKYLKLGKRYTVNYVMMYGRRAEVFLEEVPNVSFCSILFENR